MRKLNNFQRKETARWLLNISQGVILGGAGTLFIPGVSEHFGFYITLTIVLGLVLYFGAMYIGREVRGK